MSGPHLLDKTAATDACHSGQMDVLGVKSKNRNTCHDSSHSSCYTEKASNVQYDDICIISEAHQSSPENLKDKICNGIDHYVDSSEVLRQVDSCKGECVSMHCDISDQYHEQLTIVSKLDVIEGKNLCTAAADSCLQIPSDSVGLLIRSNSFTDSLSQVPCTASRKLAGSPKPVLRRHSMTLSRPKKQVTIEANAKVIEIDTYTSECPEIESGAIELTAVSVSNSTVTSGSDFSRTYIGTISESDNCQPQLLLFNVSQEISSSSLNVENLPLSGDMTAIRDSSPVLQEVPFSSPHKDINASDTDTSPPHAVELAAGRCRSYEVTCVEKSRVRHLVEEDDDSCGDEADDESTANEELDSECKEEREHKRKRRKSVEDEIEKVVSSSPNGRFLKFDWEIGCGSFKTVYKGLDSETGVHIAWCELQVCVLFIFHLQTW